MAHSSAVTIAQGPDADGGSSHLKARAALLVGGGCCECACAAPRVGTGYGHGVSTGWECQEGAAGCCTTTSQTCPAELPSASTYSPSDKTLNIQAWRTPGCKLSAYCAGAASTRVGHELGSGKPRRAQLAAATVIGLEVMLMVIVVGLGTALRDVWGYLFTSDPEVQGLATVCSCSACMCCAGVI